MPTEKAFEVLRKGGDPGKTIANRDKANDRLIDKVLASKPRRSGFEFKRRGEEGWNFVNTGPKLRNKVENLPLSTGGAIWARRAGSNVIYVLRAVEVFIRVVVPPIPDSSATDGVKDIWKAIWEEIPELEQDLGYELVFVYQGIYNCRRIDGSSLWSQHAWRNGLDWHLNKAGTGTIDMNAMDKLIARLKARGVAAELLWRVTDHYGHAHGTGPPKRFGTPACA